MSGESARVQFLDLRDSDGNFWRFNVEKRELKVVSADTKVNPRTGATTGSQWLFDDVELSDIQTVERVADKVGVAYDDALQLFEEMQKVAPDPYVASIKVYNGDDVAVAHSFMRAQPVWYDAETGLWWLWDFRAHRWVRSNEVEVLHRINRAIHPSIVEAKELTVRSGKSGKLLAAIKQASCDPLMKPLPFKKTWIQFADVVVDVETGEEFPVSHKYFAVNPIPWRLAPKNEEELYDCPTIDGLLRDWVVNEEAGQDESYVDTAYELIAYAMLPDNPLQKWFVLSGSGANGKGSFERFLTRFLGDYNVGHTFLGRLLKSSFESTSLYQKLACFVQEANGKALSDSMLIKAATGDDTIPAEFKFVNRFEFKPYAKIIMSSNELPMSDDDSDAWFRRIVLLGFPNKFLAPKDGGQGVKLRVEDEIPEWEYPFLARKCLNVLRRLLQKKEFVNEQALEAKRLEYHYLSNPVEHFIAEGCTLNNESTVSFSDFYEALLDFLAARPTVSRLSRKRVGKLVREAGYRVGRERVVDLDRVTTQMVVYGLELKNAERR